MRVDSKYVIGAAAAAGIAIAAFAEAPRSPATSPSGPSPTSQAVQGQLPEGHPPVTGDEVAPPLSGERAPAMAGTVGEVLQGAGYTYVLLDTEDGEAWIAGPSTAVGVGDSLSLPSLMDMGTFRSEALDRTFDPLYFTDTFAEPGAPAPGFGGTVLQAFTADRYMILEVETEGSGERLWIAATGSGVDEGARVAWGEGTMMQDFHSATLDRTFDRILFVNRIQVRP